MRVDSRTVTVIAAGVLLTIALGALARRPRNLSVPQTRNRPIPGGRGIELLAVSSVLRQTGT
jgi:hypothetical protein